MAEKTFRVFMVAGEASADLLGSLLLKELKLLHPTLEAFGVGGARLEKEGLEVLVPASEISILGISGVVKQLPALLRKFSSLVDFCRKKRPDVAILLDLPDFNLRMAKKIKSLGIPVVYYISPQIWAWRKSRIKTIQKFVDKMIVLFPFEKEFYERHQVSVTFVGHPLVEHVLAKVDHRTNADIGDTPRVALLPGSRRSEIEYHAPLFRDLLNGLRLKYGKVDVRVPVAPTLDLDWVKAQFSDSKISFENINAQEVLRWADVAVVASGTATLEAALVTVPFMLVYRVSGFHAFLFRLIVRWKGFLAMPNLLLGSGAIQEYFQRRATAANLFKETEKILSDQSYRSEMISQLERCREILGQCRASSLAAKTIHDLVSPA